MKKILFFVYTSLFTALSAQSFLTPITPATRTLQMGTGLNNAFAINVVPSGGFSSSVNYSLTVPPELKGAVSISTTLVNSPYPAAFIHVDQWFAPEGTFTLTLKSFNGSYEIHTVCTLIVSHNYCPNWFVYQQHNSVIPSTYGMCTGLDRSENFWVGSFATSTLPNPLGSIACFDKNNWYVWSTQDYRVYNSAGVLTSSTTSQKIMDWGVKEIATYGDTVYAISDYHLYSIINKSLTILPGPQITAAFAGVEVDKNGGLWIRTANDVYQLTGNTWTPLNLSSAPFASNTTISDFEVDKKGNQWFAAGALHKFDGTFWTTFNSTNGLPVGAQVVECAKNGTVWAGPSSSNKIYKFDESTSTFSSVTTNGGATNITFDHMNNPVVASPSGISIVNGSSLTVYHNLNSAVIPNPNFIQGESRMASVDSNGNMIVANRERGIVYHCVNNVVTGIPVNFESTAATTLFPNPASGQFRVTRPNATSNFDLNIYDLNGRLMFSQYNVSVESIDAGLESGLYFVVIKDVNSRSTSVAKLVITK